MVMMMMTTEKIGSNNRPPHQYSMWYTIITGSEAIANVQTASLSLGSDLVTLMPAAL